MKTSISLLIGKGHGGWQPVSQDRISVELTPADLDATDRAERTWECPSVTGRLCGGIPVVSGEMLIGDWQVRPDVGTVTRGEKQVKLEPKIMQVLVYLADHAGDVLPRERLVQAVWPDTFVTDDVLTHAISEIRKAFGDDSRDPRYVQTLPRRGYRLIAPVVREVKADPLGRPEASVDTPTVPPTAVGGTRATWLIVTPIAIAALIVAAYWFSKQQTIYRVGPELTPVPLTAYIGLERQPSFSPDGSQVAFVWNGPKQDNFDIYVKVIGTERPHRLTSGPEVEGSPAWSPDGREIAFLRQTGEGSEVRVISPIGGAERLLGLFDTQSANGLAWSPDGQTLAVPNRSSKDHSKGIVLLDVTTGETRQLTRPPPGPATQDYSPAFSPDGQTIAFQRQLGTSVHRAFIAPMKGGEPRELASAESLSPRLGGWVGNSLAWSGDGEGVVLGLRPAFLWRVSVETGQRWRLAGTEDAGGVAVSRFGERVAYSKETTEWDIWRINLLESDTEPRSLGSSTRPDLNPGISPDGKHVVFNSARSGFLEIWVTDSSGENRLQLTSLGEFGAVGSPRWSPTGEEIVFDHACGGQSDICVIGASGGVPRQITRSPSSDVTPSWSRNGQSIYFASDRTGDWQVWRIPVRGEEKATARQVTRGSGFNSIESADGEYLFYARRRSDRLAPENAIWRVPAEGGAEEPVINSLNSSFGNWDVTSGGIYFVERQEQALSEAQWVVKMLHFENGRVTRLAPLRHPPFLDGPAFSVSRDGRWLLSAQEQSAADLMLIESFR